MTDLDTTSAARILPRSTWRASTRTSSCRPRKPVARVRSDARIVLDALPATPIPARVSFVAAEAQFTPKAVETRSERDKLMFRVKVRVDRDLLRAHAAEVRTGLPGVAYVRLDPAVAWPAALRGGPGG